jgi:hypothetical protein
VRDDAAAPFKSAHSHTARRYSQVQDAHDDHSHYHRGLVVDEGLDKGCGTPDATTEQRVEMRAAAMEYEANNALGARQTPSYLIQTWIHVIAKDATTGQVASTRIDEMIAALNEKYTGSAFSFELAGTKTTVNPIWHFCKKTRQRICEQHLP